MRSMLILAVLPFTLLVGCADTATKPAEAPKTAETKPAEAAKPQCWSSDHNKFFDVGAKTEISGVKVECKATASGKNAQWTGAK